LSTSERPGVYASYEVSGVSYSGTGGGTAGAAAAAASGTAGQVYDVTSYAAAEAAFGSGSALTELCRILIKNGVSAVKAVPVTAASPAASDYSAAFTALAACADVRTIVCDSRDAAVHAALKNAIESADERCRHKIGFVEGSGAVSGLIAAAAALNSERMVMVAPAGLAEDGSAAVAGALAAAVSAAAAAQTDPALPLNGAALYGLGGVTASYSDSDITLLVRGGVTPVECLSGGVSVVRGITTRTTTNGAADATYRELTTIMIIDDVIPDVRDALQASFSRTKNTARTRGAIRTRVLVELEKKLAAEIIDGYGAVTAAVSSSDPTVCDVSFEFTVAHGLNRIRLTAYITV